jgi:hypothetical protein
MQVVVYYWQLNLVPRSCYLKNFRICFYNKIIMPNLLPNLRSLLNILNLLLSVVSIHLFSLHLIVMSHLGNSSNQALFLNDSTRTEKSSHKTSLKSAFLNFIEELQFFFMGYVNQAAQITTTTKTI